MALTVFLLAVGLCALVQGQNPFKPNVTQTQRQIFGGTCPNGGVSLAGFSCTFLGAGAQLSNCPVGYQCISSFFGTGSNFCCPLGGQVVTTGTCPNGGIALTGFTCSATFGIVGQTCPGNYQCTVSTFGGTSICCPITGTITTTTGCPIGTISQNGIAQTCTAGFNTCTAPFVCTPTVSGLSYCCSTTGTITTNTCQAGFVLVNGICRQLICNII